MESSALTGDGPTTSQTSSDRSCSRTVLLQELINIRNSIKKIQDWMPPTSPSAPTSDVPSPFESPLTGDGFSHGHFDEMTRSTLLKCFEKIVDVIEKKSQQEQTMGDLLAKYPLARTVTKGTIMSINMFQSGMEVDEISLIREIRPTTVRNHLCAGLLINNSIDVGRLLPAYKLASLIRVLKSPSINYDMRTLPPIRKLCRNPRVTFHEISICRAYLKVRQHLTALNLTYEDNYSLVTVDNKSEYKSKLMSPEYNALKFLPKCVFPSKSKGKKDTKKLSKKEKKEINICPSTSTAVSENQVNNNKNDSIGFRRLSFPTGANDPPYENVQNVNVKPTEPSFKVECSEINLQVQSDVKPSNIKLENAVIDISDSELTEGELQENENATESNHIKGSIPDERVSEDKMIFSDNIIIESERFSPSPTKELKTFYKDFPLQELSKSSVGVKDYPKSNNQTEFNVEWDGAGIIKKENIDEKVSKKKIIDDTDNIIIIDDDDDDKLFSSGSNLDKIKDVNEVKDALSKGIEVYGKGKFITTVKHEIKSDNSFTTSTVITVIEDTTKSTRKRKLNENMN